MIDLLVSYGQTAFFFYRPLFFFYTYSDGEKGSGELRIVFLLYKSPDFGIT